MNSQQALDDGGSGDLFPFKKTIRLWLITLSVRWGKGKLVGMVLLDLRKAFDTVNHDIMIEKLRAAGIASTDWFHRFSHT